MKEKKSVQPNKKEVMSKENKKKKEFNDEK